MNKKGFTLIELIVVIAIIGLLSTLAVVALGSARLKARDTQRLSNLKQLQTALELYYTDRELYPDVPNNAQSVVLGKGDAACLNYSGWHESGCGDAIMGIVPVDPQVDHDYVYSVNNSSYTITATLEGTSNGYHDDIQMSPSGIVQQ